MAAPLPDPPRRLPAARGGLARRAGGRSDERRRRAGGRAAVPGRGPRLRLRRRGARGRRERRGGGGRARARRARREARRRAARRRAAERRRRERRAPRGPSGGTRPTPPATTPVPTPGPDSDETGHRFPVGGAFDLGGEGSRFGAARGGHTHQGQDIAAAEGTPVLAPWAGVVEHVRYQRRGAGWYIVLDGDGEDRDYVFMHLRRGSILVTAGPARERGRAARAGGQHGRLVRPAPPLRDLGRRLVREGRRADRPAAAPRRVGRAVAR